MPRAIADTLRMADLDVPVLVQATPDTPGRMTIRVLIADDHRIVREGLRLVLSGYADIAVVGDVPLPADDAEIGVHLAV